MLKRGVIADVDIEISGFAAFTSVSITPVKTKGRITFFTIVELKERKDDPAQTRGEVTCYI